MYYEGLGIEKDYVRAYAWIRLAYINGDNDALPALEEITALMTTEELAAGGDLLQRWLEEERASF